MAQSADHDAALGTISDWEHGSLQSCAETLYKLHQHKQRYGTIGIPAADLTRSIKQGLLLAATHFRICHSSGGNLSGPGPLSISQPWALYVQGLCKCLAGREGIAVAVLHLQAAVKLSPELMQAWLVLAYCYYEQGDVTQALSCIMRGLRMSQQPSAALPGLPAAGTPTDATDCDGPDLMRPEEPDESSDRASGWPIGVPAVGNPSKAVKEGLQLLSMLVRQQHQQRSQQQQQQQGQGHSKAQQTLTYALELSRDLASAALEMDVSDAYSWYVLALAELSAFLQAPLVRPGHNIAASRSRQLQRLLASFSQAERQGLSDLADLYFNRATLHTYCQNFAEALSDYDKAKALDPSLPVARQAESLNSLLAQLSSLVASRGGIQTRQWSRVTALLAKDAMKAQQLLTKGVLHHQPGLTLCGLSDLSPGTNRGRALLCRPLVFISPPFSASAALYIVCVDTSASCLALALVRISHSAFDMTQQLTIINPELVSMRMLQQGKEVAFPLVKVDVSDSILLVDGVPVQQE